MEDKVNKVLEVIQKNYSSFDTEGLIFFLSAEKMRSQHLNDFNSIEGAVKLLNSIIYYEYSKKISSGKRESRDLFSKLAGELDDRFALENSYEWVETYNNIMDSNGTGEDKVNHSCLVKNCVNDAIIKMTENRELLIEKYYNFIQDLRDKKIHDLYTDSENCIRKRSSDIKKDCSNEYLSTYYDHMANYTSSPLWNYLIPKDIRTHLTDGYTSYRDDSVTEKLNNYFRDNENDPMDIPKDDLSDYIKILRLLVFEVSLSEDLVVYRGDAHIEFTPEITTRGFYSCDLTYERARDYVTSSMDERGRIIRIRIPAGQKFLTVYGRRRSHEIVLLPSTKIRTETTCKRGSGIYFCDYFVKSTHRIDDNLKNRLITELSGGNNKRRLIRDIVNNYSEE